MIAPLAARAVLARWLVLGPRPSRGARNPRRCDVHAFRQAGRQSPAPARPRPAQGDARRRLADARARRISIWRAPIARYADAARCGSCRRSRWHEDGDAADRTGGAAVRVSLPSDRSFVELRRAPAHVTGQRLRRRHASLLGPGLLDVLLDYPIRSDRSRFSIDPTSRVSGSVS